MIAEQKLAPQITLTLLRDAAFWQNEKIIAELEPQQPVWLLACIALNGDHAGNREEIGTLFWPEKDAQKVRLSLRQSLHSLKSLLESLALPADILHIERASLRLNSECVQTDVAEFERLLGLAQSAEAAERVALLQAAVDLYKAPLLPACYMDWVVAERERLASAYSAALHTLTGLQEAQGDWEQALATAQRALREDPLAEEMHIATMRLYAKLGRPTELQKQAKDLERVLREAFDTEPLESVQTLVQRLLEEARERAVQNTESLANQAEPPSLVSKPLAPEPVANPVSTSQPSSAPASRPRSLRWVGVLLVLCLVAGFWFKVRAPRKYVPRPGERLSGEERWVEHIPNHEGDKDSEPTAMVMDGEGNVYVTGFVDNAKTDVDFVTLKYAPDGDLLWERRFNGEANDVDRARSVAVDAKGNVYVTGESLGKSGHGVGSLSELDILTVKYAANGNQLWAVSYDAPAHGRDSGWQNLVDAEGNLLVFGQCDAGEGKKFVYTLLKYAPNGKLLGEPRFFEGTNGVEQPSRRMALAADGTLFFVGMTPQAGKPDLMSLTCYSWVENRTLWQKSFPHANHPSFLQLYMSRVGEPILLNTYYHLDKHEYAIHQINARTGGVLWEWASSTTKTDSMLGGLTESLNGSFYFAGCLNGIVNIMKFDAPLNSKSLKWQTSYHGTAGTAQFGAIAPGPDDSLYVSGSASYKDPLRKGSADEIGEEIFTVQFDTNWPRKRTLQYVGSNTRLNNAIALFTDKDGGPVVCGRSFGKRNFGIVTIWYRP